MPLRIRSHISYPKVSRQEPALVRREVSAAQRFAWTDERDDLLRSLWSWMPRKAIAERIGVTPSSMFDRAEVLKLPKRLRRDKKMYELESV